MAYDMDRSISTTFATSSCIYYLPDKQIHVFPVDTKFYYCHKRKVDSVCAKYQKDFVVSRTIKYRISTNFCYVQNITGTEIKS